MSAFHSTRLLGPVAALATLAGCATTRLDAQWSDPQAAPGSLHGARVMVACEAPDMVIRRICQDRMSAEIAARGGTPVSAPDLPNEVPGQPLAAEQYLAAARSANAKAVLTHFVAEAGVAVNPPPSVSFGIGGFGFGGGGGAVGSGVGVTAPVGSAQANVGYAITSNLLDVSSGHPLLMAKASSPPSGDVNRQIDELTKVVFSAADNAKLF
jgi:hypothetical protein